MDELEDISGHISDRISSLQRMVDLSVVELPQNKMKKLGQELFMLERLLEEFEKCVRPTERATQTSEGNLPVP
ncbi:hypothetical protein GBF38_020838 [Nibea albiflora]|uniref:Uncharacterized protein n=1 Tax=Nibea albiflora TaxID=240163 RepID=A0ACB7FEF0_NIBAL|nr:hypothetical protein GBF38_020838 [Nibea albiflora]